jgi:hypothetical protein
MYLPHDDQELDLAPPVDEDDMSTPFMEEKERMSAIVFLITTMSEIRLKDQLARTYFREVYCGLPGVQFGLRPRVVACFKDVRHSEPRPRR